MEKSQEEERKGLQSWSKQSIARQLEVTEIQLLSILLIYFDVLAWFTKVLIETRQDRSQLNEMIRIEKGVVSLMLVRLIDSFTNFTLCYFVLEIGALLFAFRLSFFSHVGYCLDLAVIISCLFGEMTEGNDFVRLSVFLRFWRLARFANAMIDVESRAHKKTKSELSKRTTKIKTLHTKLKIADDKLRKELDLKKQVEKMMLGYKDEVETLNEALQIAAHDIADMSQERETPKKPERSTKLIDSDGDVFFDNLENE